MLIANEIDNHSEKQKNRLSRLFSKKLKATNRKDRDDIKDHPLSQTSVQEEKRENGEVSGRHNNPLKKPFFPRDEASTNLFEQDKYQVQYNWSLRYSQDTDSAPAMYRSSTSNTTATSEEENSRNDYSSQSPSSEFTSESGDFESYRKEQREVKNQTNSSISSISCASRNDSRCSSNESSTLSKILSSSSNRTSSASDLGPSTSHTAGGTSKKNAENKAPVTTMAETVSAQNEEEEEVAQTDTIEKTMVQPCSPYISSHAKKIEEYRNGFEVTLAAQSSSKHGKIENKSIEQDGIHDGPSAKKTSLLRFNNLAAFAPGMSKRKPNNVHERLNPIFRAKKVEEYRNGFEVTLATTKTNETGVNEWNTVFNRSKLPMSQTSATTKSKQNSSTSNCKMESNEEASIGLNSYHTSDNGVVSVTSSHIRNIMSDLDEEADAIRSHHRYLSAF